MDYRLAGLTQSCLLRAALYYYDDEFGKVEFPAFLKESLAKNFVRQPFG